MVISDRYLYPAEFQLCLTLFGPDDATANITKRFHFPILHLLRCIKPL